MNKNTEIYKLLNDSESVYKFSNEIANSFINKACKENIEFNFDIAKGTGKLKTKSANTSFCYDPDPGDFVYRFKKALYNEDLKDIAINSEEEKELMEAVSKFIKEVSKEIMNGYSLSIRNKIREIVLPKSSETTIPLEDIEILTIDIADYDSIPDPAKYLLKVGKKPNTDINIDKITTFVHERQEKTGQTLAEIFELEKRKNILFKNVLTLERGSRYLHDIFITFFVDYSLAYLPPCPSKN